MNGEKSGKKLQGLRSKKAAQVQEFFYICLRSCTLMSGGRHVQCRSSVGEGGRGDLAGGREGPDGITVILTNKPLSKLMTEGGLRIAEDPNSFHAPKFGYLENPSQQQRDRAVSVELSKELLKED